MPIFFGGGGSGPVATFRGALVDFSTAGPVIATATPTVIDWQETGYDTDSIWNIANPSRLTVPAGVSFVQLWASVNWTSSRTGTVKLRFLLNGGGNFLFGLTQSEYEGITLGGSELVSPPLSVIGGQYFELEVTQTSGAPVQIDLGEEQETCFAMSILG